MGEHSEQGDGIPRRLLRLPVLVVGLLVLALAYTEWRPRPSVETRLAGPSDDGTSAQDLTASLERLQREARPLMAKDERQATRFLAWTATASGFRVERLKLEAGSVGATEQAVDVGLHLRGQVYDLPLVLESLSSQAALLQLDALVIDVEKGGACTVALSGRYHRPLLPDPDRALQRVRELVPEADAATHELLVQATRHSAWRAFAAQAKARSAASAASFSELTTVLPPAIVQAAREGGRVTWARGAEVRATRLAGPAP